MKKSIVLLSSYLILAVLLTSCSDTYQDKYDEALSELHSLQDQYTQLERENDRLQDELNEAQKNAESVEAEYSTLKTENSVITRELEKMKKSYEDASQELSALQMAGQPKYFSTSQELESWIQSNAVSDTPIHSNLLKSYEAYERCLEIQETALGDGFIISVSVEGGAENVDYGETRSVYCQAETVDGIYWWLPDRDEIELIEFYGEIEANFAGDPLQGIAPLTVNFTSLSKGEITSWYWEFGDGETSRARHPTHTYTLPGIYTVSLKVTGLDSTLTKMISDYIYVN